MRLVEESSTAGRDRITVSHPLGLGRFGTSFDDGVPDDAARLLGRYIGDDARRMPASDPWTKSTAAGAPDAGGALRAIGPVLHFAQDRDIYSEGGSADVFFKLVSGVFGPANSSATAGAR
jgi:hypothetical protein